MKTVCLFLASLILAACAPEAEREPAPPTRAAPEEPARPDSSLWRTAAETVRLEAGAPEHRYPLRGETGVTNLPARTLGTTGLRVAGGDLATVRFLSATRQGDGLRVVLPLEESEALYGFGERFGEWNQRGQSIDVWTRDMAQGGPDSSYFAVPFLVSSGGYGLFVNSPTRIRFDCGKTDPDRLVIEVAEPGADLFVFRGPMAGISRAYTRLAGRPQPVPAWTFRPWISRNSYLSAYEVDAVLGRMRAEDLHPGVVVLEAWAQGLQNFQFETNRYPKAGAWIRRLHQQDVRVVLWETPSIWTNTTVYPVARERDFLVKEASGAEVVVDWLEEGRLIDFRKPEARDWWTGMHRRLVEMGVDGFKTDGGERMPDPHTHNLFPYLYQRSALAAFDGAERAGLTFARSANPSCAAHSTFWAGDQHAEWASLPRVVRAGLSAAISGFPYWSHDIGGYIGTARKDLYIRWMQLGTLSPIMQFHGIPPREPYHYDEETLRIARWCFALREALMPYLLEAAATAREEGIPMWRPMNWVYPDRADYADAADQFFLGPDMLVAPVLTAREARRVRIPPGEWIDAWTGMRVAGPAGITVQAPLHKIPLYVRAEAADWMNEVFEDLPAPVPEGLHVTLEGEKNELGVVPRVRRIDRPYEKLFLTVHNPGPDSVSGHLDLNAHKALSVVPSGRQAFRAEPGGRARLAFYITATGMGEPGLEALRPGSYPVSVSGRAGTRRLHKALGVSLFVPPRWEVAGPVRLSMRQEGPLAKGRSLDWQPVPPEAVDGSGYLDVGALLGGVEGPTTAYLRARLDHVAPGPGALYAGSGDAMTLWLNGRRVFDKRVYRSPLRDEDRIPVHFRAGANELTVRLTREMGPLGMYLRVQQP